MAVVDSKTEAEAKTARWEWAVCDGDRAWDEKQKKWDADQGMRAWERSA